MANDDGHRHFFAHLNKMKAASSLTLSKQMLEFSESYFLNIIFRIYSEYSELFSESCFRNCYFWKFCRGDVTTLDIQRARNMVFQSYFQAQLSTQII